MTRMPDADAPTLSTALKAMGFDVSTKTLKNKIKAENLREHDVLKAYWIEFMDVQEESEAQLLSSLRDRSDLMLDLLNDFLRIFAEDDCARAFGLQTPRLVGGVKRYTFPEDAFVASPVAMKHWLSHSEYADKLPLDYAQVRVCPILCVYLYLFLCIVNHLINVFLQVKPHLTHY